MLCLCDKKQGGFMENKFFSKSKKRFCAFLTAFSLLSSFAFVADAAVVSLDDIASLETGEYAILNVAEGKTIKSVGGALKNALVDGVVDGSINQSANPQNVLEDNDYIILDLGKPYELAAIGIISGNGAGSHWTFSGVDFYGTDDPSTGLSGAVKLWEMPNNPGRTNPAGEVSGTYRYVIASKNNQFAGHKALWRELYVYAKVQDEFGEWSVSDANGIVNMSIPFLDVLEPNTFELILTTYDENGFMKQNAPSVAEGAYMGAVFVPQDEASAQAVIVEGEEWEVVSPVGYWNRSYAKANGSADNFDAAVSLIPGEDNAVISGKSVEETDVITVKAIKSDMADSEAAFAAGGTVCWFGSTASGNGYEIKIPFSEEGQYHIRVTRYTKDKTVEHKYYPFKIIDPTLREANISGFMNSDGTNLKALADEAIDELGILSADILIDYAILEDGTFGQTYLDVKALMEVQNADMNAVIKILNTATVVSYLKSGDNSLMAEYSDLITENEAVKRYVESELGFSFSANVIAETLDGTQGVTNINTSGLLSFSFTEAMNKATLTSDTVVLKKDGQKVNYTPYKADENSFVIDMASLSSGSNYTVEFTACCKTLDGGLKMAESKIFSYGTGKILNMPHREGNIIKNVLLGRDFVAQNGRKISGWTNGVLDTVVGGLSDTTFVAVSPLLAVDGTYAVVDLGRCYDLTGIKTVSTTTNWNYFGAKFYAGNDAKAGIAGSDELMEIAQADVAAGKLTFEKEFSGSYRYIYMQKTNDQQQMQEVEAYAYVDTYFGQWNVPTLQAGAANYTFSIPIEEYSDAKSYYMIINAYDENGMTVVSNTAEVTESNGVLSSNLSVSASEAQEVSGINAMLVYDLTTMKQVVDAAVVGAKVSYETEDVSGVSITNDDNGAYIKIGPSDVIKNTDNVSVTVVTNTEVGKSAKEVFEGMTATELNNSLVFNTSVSASEKASYTLDTLPEGKYYVMVSANDIEGNTTEYYYKFVFLSTAAKNTLISGVFSSDATALETIVENAVFTDETIIADGLADANALSDPDYYQIAVYTRDMLYTAEEAAGITNVDEVIKVLDAAALINAFYNNDNAKAAEILKSKGTLLAGHMDTAVRAEYVNNVFSQLKSRINNQQSFEDVLKWSGMLSHMYDTDAKKAEALTKYASELGIDVSYASANNVSLQRAASFINTTSMSNLYGKTNFNAAYQAAVLAAKANDELSGSRPVTNNGNSGGGNSFFVPSKGTSSDNGAAAVAPVAKPQTIFSDMSAYGWATDAVNTLVKNRIIDGYPDGSFNPEGCVTRAQFIKMLVVATNAEIKEKREMNFDDVPANSWYYPYIKIAYANMLCQGVSKTSFNPDGYITRQDMAVLIYNFMKHIGMSTAGESKEFSDSGSISAYAYDAVSHASAAGVINGRDDGSFAPLENARRVDAAVMISKIMAKEGK